MVDARRLRPGCLWLAALAVAVVACEAVQPQDDDHGDTRAAATAIAAPAPVTRLSGSLETSADVDMFTFVVTSAATVYAASRFPDVDVSVGSAHRSSASGTPHDALTVDPGNRGSVDVYVRVSGGSAPYDLAVWLIDRSAPDATFNIELLYVGAGPTPRQRAIIDAAARVWERVITRGLPDAPVLSASWKCEDEDPSPFGDRIDDLRVYIRLKPDREAEKGLAVSGVCWQREDGLPLISDVTLLPVGLSLADDVLSKLVVHELAHALGFGSIGRWDDLLENDAAHHVPVFDSTTLPDTHFTGRDAVGAFDDAGGGSHSGGKVPVENDVREYGPSSVDSHWREAVFATELMTPRISASSSDQPLSKVTIAALADLGYAVDYSRAEVFTLPGTVNGLLTEQLVMLYVGDDIRREAARVAVTSGGTGSLPSGAE